MVRDDRKDAETHLIRSGAFGLPALRTELGPAMGCRYGAIAADQVAIAIRLQPSQSRCRYLHALRQRNNIPVPSLLNHRMWPICRGSRQSHWTVGLRIEALHATAAAKLITSRTPR
jgi:hypothetical protein